MPWRRTYPVCSPLSAAVGPGAFLAVVEGLRAAATDARADCPCGSGWAVILDVGVRHAMGVSGLWMIQSVSRKCEDSARPS